MSLYEDLLDSNHIFSSKAINVFSWRVYQKKHYYYLAWGIARYFGFLFRSLKTIIYLPTFFKVKKDDILVVVTSSNQYDSIAPFINQEGVKAKVVIVEFNGTLRPGMLKFPIFISYLISIFLVPQTLYYYYTCKDEYIKKSFRYGFKEYCLTFAYRFVNRIWLRLAKPRLLIILTDHQMVARDMVKSAKASGVKTLYIQHASVTDHFPPLITDYAFLEGKDAQSKYLNISKGHTDTIIELIGITKLDGTLNRATGETAINNIGMCTNEFDDIVIADSLIALLKSEFALTLRPHPGDPRYEQWTETAKKHGILFSDSKSQKASDFLAGVNCVVSYNCGIITESLMLNKPTFSFQLSQNEFDHYGFLGHHIVDHYKKAAVLAEDIAKLRNAPNIINWKNKAKYYCDTIDTPYEGRSAELVKKLLHKYGI
jgi:hypothetical protein